MFFNGNSFGTTFGYSDLENDDFGFDGYPSEETGGGPSTQAAQASGFDLDPTLSGLSVEEIEKWWLAPRSDGDAGQYAGSTLLDPCVAQAGYVSGSNTGESCRSLSLTINKGLNTNSSPISRFRF